MSHLKDMGVHGMRTILAVVMAGLLQGLAQAEDLTRWIGAGVNAGGDLPLGSRYIKDNGDGSRLLGGWIRDGLSKRWGVGFSFDAMDFGPGAIRLQPMMANAFFQLLPASGWNPNAHAGVGMSLVDGVESPRKGTFGAKAGVGADFFANQHVSVGPSIDYYLATKNARTGHDLHVVAASLTIGFWAGGEKPAAVSAKPAPAPVVVEQPPQRAEPAAVPVEAAPAQVAPAQAVPAAPENTAILPSPGAPAVIEQPAAAPAPAAEANPAPPQPSVPESRSYVVKSGDTLYSISKAVYGTGEKWRIILKANRGRIRGAQQLEPGTELVIPEQ